MTEESIVQPDVLQEYSESPLMQLPEEASVVQSASALLMIDKQFDEFYLRHLRIWSLIFEYIPQKDLLLHRSVCKSWCKRIDTLANYRVRFCDVQDANLVDILFSQRVRACEFLGLKNPFEPNFENPLLIKEITFASSSSAENVRKILSTCSDVERLSFYTTFSSDSLFDLSQNYVPIWSSLKKLKEIEIGIQCFQSRVPKSTSSIFETLIGRSRVEFPSLQRFAICFPMFSDEWVALFKFLVRHAATLRSLKIRCFRCPDGCDGITDEDAKSLRRLNLSTLDIICDSACRHSRVHAAFADLVSVQKNLEKVNLDLLKFPLPVYISTVLNNFRSLRSVKFYHVEFGADYRIDGSLFGDCVFLTELTLHCIPRYTVIITMEGDDDGLGNHMNPNPRYEGADVHDWALPSSLQRLSLKGCHIPTTELIEFGTKHCSKLEQLELYGVGSTLSLGYGLTFEAFMQLCENLHELKVFSFRGISFSSLATGRQDRLRWTGLIEKGGELGICKNRDRDGIRPFNFVEDQESSFTFNFPTVEKRKNFVLDVRKLLSCLDIEINGNENTPGKENFEEFEGPVSKKLKMD